MSPAQTVSMNKSTASRRMVATVFAFAAQRTMRNRSRSRRGYCAVKRLSFTKSAIPTKVSTMVVLAPVNQSQSGRGKSKRWPNPCAEARAAVSDAMVPTRQQATRGVARMGKQLTGYKLWMYLEIRSEEHTSELQSQSNLVCRLLL